ncbi:MAG: hypothetical protein AAFY17_06025, partial [Cyanobacteria bacterium J06642_11]
MSVQKALGRRIRLFCGGFALSMLLTFALPLAAKDLSGITHRPAADSQPLVAQQTVAAALDQGRRLYELGQLDQAANTLETALGQSANAGLTRAIASSNLALVYGQQGNLSAAQQRINQSHKLLDKNSTSPNYWSVYAQTLNIQARLELAQDEALTAFDTWGKAAIAYRNAGEEYKSIRSRIRQARALQAQGYYQQAVYQILTPLTKQLEEAPDSAAKALGLRSLAEALQITESLEQAEEAASESLAVAIALDDPTQIAASQLTLANIVYARAQELRSREKQANDKVAEALALYQQVIDQNIGTADRFRAQLNQLSILV